MCPNYIRWVTCRVHDDEEEHAVGIHWLEGPPVAREEGSSVVVTHEEDPLEDARVEAPPAKSLILDKIKLNLIRLISLMSNNITCPYSRSGC